MEVGSPCAAHIGDAVLVRLAAAVADLTLFEILAALHFDCKEWSFEVPLCMLEHTVESRLLVVFEDLED